MRYLYYCCSLLIAFGIFLFSYHLLRGDMLFHTDIARDFLLIQDIAINHKFTLIGPRAGGIPGTFFSPIWLYLNLPAFILGKGNPIIIGYFWVLLMLAALFFTFYVAKKVFNITVACIATTFFIYAVLYIAPGFTQSFGSVIFSSLLLYTIYLFIEKKKIRYLSYAAFISGILIQFQPAFGAIFFLISFIISAVSLIKRKQIQYVFIWTIFLFPLVTYVVFEIRHNFLETHAVINFLSHQGTRVLSPSAVINNRLAGFLDTFNIINSNTLVYNIFFLALNAFIGYRWLRTKRTPQRTFVLLVYGYIVGYWLITFLFNGVVWDYYYWGFIPLVCIMIASLYMLLEKRIFFAFSGILFLLLLVYGYNAVRIWQTQFSGKDTSSWLVSLQVADYIYQDAHEDFGYYIFSTDQFGYAKRYSMSYVGSTGEYPEKGNLCTKKQITYLIYNKVGNMYVDPVYWKKAEVNIQANPISVKMIQSIKIEKYLLTPQEVEKSSDPNLVCGLEFR